MGEGLFQGRKILVAVTGGIAAYKSCSLVSNLSQKGAHLRVAMSKSATQLVGPISFQALSKFPVLTANSHKHAEHAMDHIELSQWAEIMIVAPCTANTLSKICHGIADEPISTLSLAFAGPQILCPSMNPVMWAKASVQRNVATLKKDGFFVQEPEVGMMACGDEGSGRLPEEDKIIESIGKHLS